MKIKVKNNSQKSNVSSKEKLSIAQRVLKIFRKNKEKFLSQKDQQEAEMLVDSLA